MSQSGWDSPGREYTAEWVGEEERRGRGWQVNPEPLSLSCLALIEEAILAVPCLSSLPSSTEVMDCQEPAHRPGSSDWTSISLTHFCWLMSRMFFTSLSRSMSIFRQPVSHSQCRPADGQSRPPQPECLLVCLQAVSIIAFV